MTPLAGVRRSRATVSLLFASLLMTGCTPTSAAPSVCSDATTTREMDACLAAVLQAAEVRMATAYERLLATFAEPDTAADAADVRQQIGAAQAAWLAFRRADCDATYAIYADGTIRTAAFLGCMIAHTEQRITQLENFIPY